MREKRETEREGGQGDREVEKREVKASGTSRCEMFVRMQEKFQIVLVKIPSRNVPSPRRSRRVEIV